MGLREAISDKVKELFFSLIAIGLCFFIKPALIAFGVTNEPFLSVGQVVAVIMFLCIILHILAPDIEFEFFPKQNVILVRDSVDSRAQNIELYVTVNLKSWLSKSIFRVLCSKQRDSKFYKIYWKPEKTIQIKGNENYPSLAGENGYPSILLAHLQPGQEYKYSLKIGVGTVSECRKLNIKIKRDCKPEASIVHRFLFRLIKIKFTEKTVDIRNV